MFDTSAFQVGINKLPIKTIAIVILSLLLLITCNKSHTADISNEVKLLAYEAQAKHFAIKTNKIGEQVNIQKTLVFESNKSLQVELLKNSELSKLNTQIKIVSETNIKNILAKYTGNINTGTITIKYIDSSGTHKDSVADCIAVGTKFKDSTNLYQLSGSIANNGVEIDYIKSNDSTTYNLGMQRKPGIKGYFLPWDPTLEVIHSNPNIHTISLQNVNLVNKPKWYEKRVVWGGFGLGIGIITTILLIK